MKAIKQVVGVIGVALVMGGCLTAKVDEAADAKAPRWGLAGYTMHKCTLDQTLEIMKKTEIHYLCVKDFHLPFSASDTDIAVFKEKCAAANVKPYAIGPVYMKSEEEARRAFDFAKRLGVNIVVGVPYDAADASDNWSKRVGSRRLLLVIDKLVKEYGTIRYAIHNHGPASPQMFPSVASGWELIHDLDARIGFCMDVGWEYGCGTDPIETIYRYADRIFDMHIKNFEIGKPNGAAIPLSRGKIDYVKVIKAIRAINYRGVCSLEYEKDFTDNLEPIAECTGYWHGVNAALDAQ